MKISRKKIQSLIKEASYRQFQRSSNAPFKRPSKEYVETLASMIQTEGIHVLAARDQFAGMLYFIETSVDGVYVKITIGPNHNWPTTHLVLNVDGNKYSVKSHILYFPVSGIPHVDAEFINRLLLTPIEKLTEIANTYGQGYARYREYSWIEGIMPGYPYDYLVNYQY